MVTFGILEQIAYVSLFLRTSSYHTTCITITIPRHFILKNLSPWRRGQSDNLEVTCTWSIRLWYDAVRDQPTTFRTLPLWHRGGFEMKCVENILYTISANCFKRKRVHSAGTELRETIYPTYS